MLKKNGALIAFLVLVGSGASSALAAQEVTTPPFETSLPNTAGAPPPTLVTPPTISPLNFYIVREYAQPTAWPATIKVDGIKLVTLGNRQYSQAVLRPGKHKISVHWPFLSGQSNSEVEIDISDTQPVYLALQGISQMAGVTYQGYIFNMGSGFSRIAAEQAPRIIEACCRLRPSE
jgi:hypothetical protein